MLTVSGLALRWMHAFPFLLFVGPLLKKVWCQKQILCFLRKLRCFSAPVAVRTVDSHWSWPTTIGLVSLLDAQVVIPVRLVGELQHDHHPHVSDAVGVRLRNARLPTDLILVSLQCQQGFFPGLIELLEKVVNQLVTEQVARAYGSTLNIVDVEEGVDHECNLSSCQHPEIMLS